MKQTAVEWFAEEMFKQGYFNDKQLTISNIKHFVKQAKAMEKEQIIDAYNNGDLRSAELYYNETYGN